MKLNNNFIFMTLNKAVYRYSSPHVVARHILYEHVVYVLYTRQLLLYV